jgi:hypothetical protein
VVRTYLAARRRGSDLRTDLDHAIQVFERSWAQAIMTEAVQLQRQQADESGPEPVRGASSCFVSASKKACPFA